MVGSITVLETSEAQAEDAKRAVARKIEANRCGVPEDILVIQRSSPPCQFVPDIDHASTPVAPPEAVSFFEKLRRCFNNHLIE